VLFNSWGYLLFLCLAVPLHWLARGPRTRLWILGAFSLLFYGLWRWDFLLLIVFSAGVDFIASLRIAASEVPRVRRTWLTLSLVINLGLLVFFKYTLFLYDNLRGAAGLLGERWPEWQELGPSILLPLGISFYTFQTISYTIDVYRRVVAPTRSFASFLTYVTFWPQLIAGPILRVSEVLPQLESQRRLRRTDVELGLRLVVIGLFEKIVLADNLAPMADEAFAHAPGAMTALDAWVAAFLFGLQIYFDFSGYSRIAIGSARLLGLEFPENFAWPYLARSPREFWQRWHISLSAWIRDYLYLPLTGQTFRTRSASTGGIAVATEGRDRRTPALLATWFLMGLWHGAAWTFALWGLYHALLILAYRKLRALSWLVEHSALISRAVMLALAMAGWIAFRSQSMGQALTLYGKLLDPRAYRLAGRTLDIYAYFWAAALTTGMAGTWLLLQRHRRRPFPVALAGPVRVAALALMVCGVLLCMRQVKQFIYFQF